MRICKISFHAKKRFAERYLPIAIPVIDKIILHKRLTKKEVRLMRRIENEMLQIVNRRPELLIGPNEAHVHYKGLDFVVRFDYGEGTIVTVRFINS